MEVFVIRKGDSLHSVVAAISTSSRDVEVIVKPMRKRPSNAHIGAYWSKLRKVALHQGEDIESVHAQSMEMGKCDDPFNLSASEFKDYFDLVMWTWLTQTGVDMGMY